MNSVDLKVLKKLVDLPMGKLRRQAEKAAQKKIAAGEDVVEEGTTRGDLVLSILQNKHDVIELLAEEPAGSDPYGD